MAEAEEVIGDAARHAADWSARLWKHVRGRDEPPGLELADVRRRLEVLLAALFDSPLVVRSANPPAPLSALARIWRRSAPQVLSGLAAMPGTDGRSVYLPARIAQPSDTAYDTLRRMAVQQAMRCLRGTADHYPFDERLLVRDLYLLSEVAASDRALLERAPGLREPLLTARRACAARRNARSMVAGLERHIEELYRTLLQTSPDVAPAFLPDLAGPERSLDWARRHAGEIAVRGSAPRGMAAYRGIERDSYFGEVLRLERVDASVAKSENGSEPDRIPHRPRHVARLRRRPRVREPEKNEDESKQGLWMVQTSEPIEHAEDPFGLQRPVDRAEDADPEGLGDSLSELGEARIVRTQHRAKEVLLSEDPPRALASAVPPAAPTEAVRRYPEWDYRRAAYRVDAVTVHETDAPEGARAWLDAAVSRRRAMLNEVRRRFVAIRARRSVIPQEPEGDELDLAAIVQAHAERCAGVTPSGRFYQIHRPARRDVALMILIDASGSTDAWASGADRIIDVEKEALLVVSMALHALGMPYAIQAFSGRGPHAVAVRTVKRFGERYEEGVGRRIAGLEPEEFTRIGAALRHATQGLMRQPAFRRLLLLLSDGKPNDVDEYEGRYGLEDTRRAIREARTCGIDTFALTVERVGAAYLPQIFGPGRYRVLQRPEQLSAALVEWLRHAALQVQ